MHCLRDLESPALAFSYTRIIREDYEDSGLPKINLIIFDDRISGDDFRDLFTFDFRNKFNA